MGLSARILKDRAEGGCRNQPASLTYSAVSLWQSFAYASCELGWLESGGPVIRNPLAQAPDAHAQHKQLAMVAEPRSAST